MVLAAAALEGVFFTGVFRVDVLIVVSCSTISSSFLTLVLERVFRVGVGGATTVISSS